MRARDLVALGIDGHRFGVGRRSKHQRERVDQMLHAVDAERFANSRVGSLSGGEQQRVLIAHALVSRRSCCCSMSRWRTSIPRACRRSSHCCIACPPTRTSRSSCLRTR